VDKAIEVSSQAIRKCRRSLQVFNAVPSAHKTEESHFSLFPAPTSITEKEMLKLSYILGRASFKWCGLLSGPNRKEEIFLALL
jgi:hypothetical protein